VNMNKFAKRVGFLATGSEITTGEIVNSNSREMAAQMQEYGIHMGEHLICDDDFANIEASLKFLLPRHEAVIITGGLGPTSDDCTKNVVASLAGQELKFNEASWNKIVARLSKRKLPIPENNRQQAYFPSTAKILVNSQGTADGCYITIKETSVFLLPGPPRECMPMFNTEVLPFLLTHRFGTPKRLFRWRLMGISESKIAELLTPFTHDYGLEFAFRASYPYVDIKLFLDPNNKQHKRILFEVQHLVRPYFVTHLNESMRAQLMQHLQQHPISIYLNDQATMGAMHQALIRPETLNYIVLEQNTQVDLEVTLSGLQEYWHSDNASSMTELHLALKMADKAEAYTTSILLRGRETIEYALEFCATKILNFI